ncbi:hypothetical protein MPTK1_7g05240 [Marchantia polymorpha subsp. ruderalis]|uniref:Uncharacterized protein n=2 Tax=Marchantia polymorpha TaxID=3197 RepID=A0AAF6BWC4_MARPO|nr:hypothetical protein MARPO_0062s0002 [Marchantia polymorpha]BBN16308.1 hypothetical protein Mp_7g05240 [Marchantia polymorpha subsp. ruderalis]|eukprot:PTQ36573.1 hypothetical protein MARPO_0062s0002 [Marchantia polymorpha]
MLISDNPRERLIVLYKKMRLVSHALHFWSHRCRLSLIGALCCGQDQGLPSTRYTLSDQERIRGNAKTRKCLYAYVCWAIDRFLCKYDYSLANDMECKIANTLSWVESVKYYYFADA